MSSYGGIDLGGTKIQAAVVDEQGKVLGQARRPTPTSGGPPDVARELEGALREAATEAHLEPSDLAGVGVGSPGRVEEGNVTEAGNLPGWEGTFPLAGALEKALGAGVKLGNDVMVATIAECRLGAGRPYGSLIGVFWGTGVGGGLILDREPWRGRGGAGEIGHMVVELDGARCTCGRKGCVEAYAGRAAMERHVQKLVEKGRKTKLFELMREHGRSRLTSGVWARALEHGDKLAVEMIERAVAALGAGIASAQNLLDLEAVIIGGGLGVRLGDEYAGRIAQAMHPHLFVDSNPPAVHVAALGDLGGAIGASLLVRDAHAASSA
ncbi:MAG TPA: ROK family protein [Solirubrobacteraceae bacterium]|jgi:glucokinase|nr:ROK family protein [Solirubrobacteraceae bacterium]